jgi:hypothetical protein
MKVKNNEIDRRIEALLRSQEEFRKGQEEFRKGQEESHKKTDEAINRLVKEQEKTDLQLKKTGEEITRLSKKTDEEIRNLRKEVGKVTDGLGRFAEGLVAPSVPKLFSKFGIKINNIFPRAQATDMRGEVDLLCPGSTNGKKIALVGEVKTRLTSEYVKEFIENLSEFRDLFPDYKDRDIIGFVSGMTVEANAKRYAEKEGFYVLVPGEDIVKIVNKPGFKPKIW